MKMFLAGLLAGVLATLGILWHQGLVQFGKSSSASTVPTTANIPVAPAPAATAALAPEGPRNIYAKASPSPAPSKPAISETGGKLVEMLASVMKQTSTPTPGSAATPQKSAKASKDVVVGPLASAKSSDPKASMSEGSDGNPKSAINLGEELFQTGGAAATAPKGAAAYDPDFVPQATAAAGTGGAPSGPAAFEAKVYLANEASFNNEVLSHNSTPVLVDFYATWCGPCKAIAPRLADASREYAGKLKIVKVDIDSNRSLAQKYQVSAVPTLIMFKNGQAVDRVTGAPSPDSLKAGIERHI